MPVEINLVTGNLYHFSQVLPPLPSVGADSGSEGLLGPQLNYNSRLQTVTVLGRGWTHSAMTQARMEDGLIKLLTASGSELTFTPIGNGEYTVRDGCCTGSYLRAWLTGQGIEVEERGGITWFYDVSGRLLRRSTRHGLTWTYEYDAGHRLTAYTDPYGRSYRFTHNSQGMLERITDPAGAVTRFTYAGDHLVQLIDARGFEERFEYDARNLLSRYVDKPGHTWQFAYDADGYAIAVTDETGATLWVWYAGPGAATVIDRRGQATV